MPPTDPRFLDTNPFQMEDEFRAAEEYERLRRGEPDLEFESDATEEELLAELDELDELDDELGDLDELTEEDLLDELNHLDELETDPEAVSEVVWDDLSEAERDALLEELE